MSLFNENFPNASPVAIELFSAAWCNLDCKYCYIPKADNFLLPIHKKLVNIIENHPDIIIDRIKRVYKAENIQYISHWGTEPSLTFHKFRRFYELALKEFPNLRHISLSSNFMKNSDKMAKFILEFPTDREMEFRIQMSLDGPEWITDNLRRKGSTKVIVNNIYKFYKLLNSTSKLKHKIFTHFKPTISKEYFYILDIKKLDEYYSFFNNIIGNLRDLNKNNIISTLEESIHFTIVCPDEYTKRDGIEFSSLYERLKLLREKKQYDYVQPQSSYIGALERLGRYGDEFFTKHRMFTCSAGDSQFGLNEYLHICHESYYLKYDGIEKCLREDSDRLSNDRQLVENGNIELAKDNLVIDLDCDKKEFLEYVYRFRGFHDFAKLKLSFAISMILLLAKAGQVSDVYKNLDWAKLLAVYTNTRHGCPAQNSVRFGSPHINHPGFYKLFGNGFLEEVITDLFCK